MSDQLTPREQRLLDSWPVFEPPEGFADRVLGARAARRRLVWLAAAGAITAAAAVATMLWTQPGRNEATPQPMVQPSPAVAPASGARPELEADLGDSFTVHDPDAFTRIRLRDGGRCKYGMWVMVSHDGTFASPRIYDGMFELTEGHWWYRVHCIERDPSASDQVIANGRIDIVRDDGRRPLAKVTPDVIDVNDDGLEHRVSYVFARPDVVFRAAGRCDSCVLHVMPPDRGQQVLDDRTFIASGGTVRIAGTQLGDEEHEFWFDDGGGHLARSKLVIAQDGTAAYVHFDEPKPGASWQSGLTVAGTMLATWRLAASNVSTSCDPFEGTCHFGVAYQADATPHHVFVMRFDHEKLGTHYYVLRAP